MDNYPFHKLSGLCNKTEFSVNLFKTYISQQLTKKQIHNKKSLTQIRKSLRNFSTSAEAVLWTKLNKKQIEGLKFRRQHSIGNFVVDFYCPRLNLVIELDGEFHASYQDIIRDEKRDNYLNNLGIEVLRFENKVVFENLEEIINQIIKLKVKIFK